MVRISSRRSEEGRLHLAGPRPEGPSELQGTSLREARPAAEQDSIRYGSTINGGWSSCWGPNDDGQGRLLIIIEIVDYH